MQEVLSYLSALKYPIGNIQLDGSLHRDAIDAADKKKAFWYIGWINNYVKGSGEYEVIVCGSHREPGVKHQFSSGKNMSKADKLIEKSRFDEAAKKYQEDLKLKNAEAAELAQKRFATFTAEHVTEYMRRKEIDKHYGTKVYQSHDAWNLVVPCYDINGYMWGYQKILDVKYNGTDKLFCTGQRKKGVFHVIGNIEDDELFLCEGYATGVSIHRATGRTTVVAFDAGNLSQVAKELRSKYVDVSITVCADNDRFKDPEKNPGVEAAHKAALMCSGGVKIPEFPPDSKGTDFNDLHIECGLEAVKDQLSEPAEVNSGFMHLGYNADSYYFYEMRIKDIVKLSSFSNTQMFHLADKQYWYETYQSKTGIAWDNAKNDLIQRSKAVGLFDPNRVRGSGVWMDEGRVVVNTGLELVVNSKRIAMSAFKSRYVYIKTKNVIAPIHPDPLSVEECRTLVDLCLLMKWNECKSGFLFAGWLALARICGSLPVRPHMWLTGGSGTGKSTMMEQVVNNMLASGKVYAQGGSTEAGIRQTMKGSSVALVCDEFETNDANTQRNDAILELFRQAWSVTTGMVIKGTVGGTSEMYSVGFAGLLSSIRVGLSNDADRSRFSIVELMPHGNDPEHWDRIKSLMADLTVEYGERLFARMVNMVPIVLKNYEMLRKAMAGRMGMRFAQQTGMIMAGYCAIVSDEPIDKPTAEIMVEDLDLAREQEEVKFTDHAECLNYLMTWKIQIKDEQDKAIGLIIKGRNNAVGATHESQLRLLESYGIMIYKDTHLFIASNNAELGKIFAKTRWIKDWSTPLQRLNGAYRDQFQSKTFTKGYKPRGVFVPLSHLD